MKNDIGSGGRAGKLLEGKEFEDQYGNIFRVTEKLAQGGQGIVFRTQDPDIAIKQPLDENGNPDTKSDLSARFQNIRLLPLPAGIQIALPLSITKNEPGYVMSLLRGMNPLSSLHMDGRDERQLLEENIPMWLKGVPNLKDAARLLHYAKTGGCKQRCNILFKCAAILARIHNCGILYGDVSLDNVFFGLGDNPEVWLIDADNLRFERIHGGSKTYTPRLGAPEIVQGNDSSRPRSDCWAFAVMAYELLALAHPFIGSKVGLEDDEDDWAADPSEKTSMGREEQAYAGYFPYIYDENDDSNRPTDHQQLPRLVFSDELFRLFQETFGVGREHPHRRPAMSFWAIEFARAHDQLINCSQCGMSYFPVKEDRCPYCDSEKPRYLRVSTPIWKYFVQEWKKENPPKTCNEIVCVSLPERVFRAFSLKTCNEIECEIIVDFKSKKVSPERGFVIPEGVTFEFIGE